jgi:hypothetical protein
VNETEANGGHTGDRTLDRTRSLCDRTHPVSVQRLHMSQLFYLTRCATGHSRPDVSGRSRSLLDSNRTLALWHPVSSAARPVAVSLERCSGLSSASGPLRDQRVLLSPARLASYGSARPVELCGATSASGPRDQRVRSARLWLFQVPNGSIRRGTSINTRWPAQSSISCTL